MRNYLTVLICFSFLSACAGSTPMAELEAQALASGDWSEVEKRERINARRSSKTIDCGRGVAVCAKRGGKAVCHCVSRSSIQGILTGRPR